MRTIQTLVDEVRRILNDSREPYRTSDEMLVALINNYFVELFRLRPDAYVPYSANTPLPSFSVSEFSSEWPVGEQFYQPAVYHVVGNVELQDDEHTDTGRAFTLLDRSIQILQDSR